MILQERMLIKESESGELYRVVWMDPERTFLMPMHGKGWERLVRTTYAMDWLRSGEFEVVEVADVSTRTSGAAAHIDTTHDVFKPFLRDTLKLLSDGGRGEVFRLIKASVPKMSKSTFYKYIRRWLQGGCIPNALAPAWKQGLAALDTSNLDAMSFIAAQNACRAKAEKLMLQGRPAAETHDHTKAGYERQRRRLNDRTRYIVDRATLRLFTHYFARVKQGTSVATAHEDMCNETFSTQSAIGNIEPWPAWAVPSFSQFRDWYYVIVEHGTRLRNRKGNHDFNLNGRARTGQGVSADFSAATVASADATIWNVSLVGDQPGAPIIGPPVVFRIRCKNTGQLLGLGVSLENAGWMGMATAIANINEDKVAFCAKYGIEISPETWAVKGIPGTIEADCGETDNKKPHRFVAYTKCELRNLPPARPDLKPGVESDFNTLQVSLNGKTPGAIIKQFQDLTHQQFQLRGAMTLKQFMRHLIFEELQMMHRTRPETKLPPRMANDGCDTSPASMFRWLSENAASGLRHFDSDHVRLSLLEEGNATVTENGLKFRRIYYESPDAQLAAAVELARTEGRTTVPVVYDRRLVNHIYLVRGDSKRPSGYTQCDLNQTRADQHGLWGKTFREAVKVSERTAQNNNVKTADMRSMMAEWARMQREGASAAQAETKAKRELHPASKAALLNGKASARAVEKETTSPFEAILPSTALPAAMPAPPVTAPVASRASPTPPAQPTTARRGSSFAASFGKQPSQAEKTTAS